MGERDIGRGRDMVMNRERMSNDYSEITHFGRLFLPKIFINYLDEIRNHKYDIANFCHFVIAKPCHCFDITSERNEVQHRFSDCHSSHSGQSHGSGTLTTTLLFRPHRHRHHLTINLFQYIFSPPDSFDNV